MKITILLVFFAIPVVGICQQPKMHLKAFVGVNSTRFIYKERDVNSDFFFGWQGGFGFRVAKKHYFGEVDFSFVRFTATIAGEEIGLPSNIDFKFNTFELPITAGWIPVKKPLYKWYLYGGFVNRFNVKIRARFEDEKFVFRPREADLPVYGVSMRLGTQFDLAMINFDFNYSVGLTNAVRDVVRTNLHVLQLNVGLIY